jgi:hypothetical protein
MGFAEGAGQLVDLGLQVLLPGARAMARAAGQGGAAAVQELVPPGRDRGLRDPLRRAASFIDTSPRSTASTMRSFSSTGLTGGRLIRLLQLRPEAKFELSQEV